jgi:hypothetical protein
MENMHVIDSLPIFSHFPEKTMTVVLSKRKPSVVGS